MASAWKTVRIFISSTFRDMHAERDHLIKRVFPRLRQWCQERRLHLVDIDLRWGVTKEEADNGAAIDICLKEIDGSRPFFVCILGNRYGWVPDPLPPEELYAFRGLQAETHLSITHLEILHAAMQSIPTKDGKTESVCEQAFFYFRDPKCIPALDALPALTNEELKELQEAFFEKLPKREKMLEGLKAEIRDGFTSDDRVFDYSGRWDAEAFNAEDELLKGRLTNLEPFGDRVETDLIRGIEDQFEEHIAALGDADDPLTNERSDHDAFIENRTQVHVPRADVAKQLSEYIDGDEIRPVVLSGPPGSGKSAILAHWVAENVDRETWLAKSDNKTFVTPRFIGASTNSVNLPRLLGNVCEELQCHFELTEEIEEEAAGDQKQTRVQMMEVPADPVQIQQKWPTFLEAAAEKGRVVIILDAINQLDRSADPMRLYWLPRELPKNVRIIVSALDHGEKSDPEYKPDKDDPLDWLSVMRRMKLPEVPVPELTGDERKKMIQEVPTVFCKTLGTAELAELLRNKATSNPLFLFIVLEELRIYGGFGKEGELLLQAIHKLPWLEHYDDNGKLVEPPDGALIVTTIDDALDALFGQILSRLQRETDRQAPGLSPTVFRLLASARDGLSEEELSGVLARILRDVDQEARDGEMQVVLRQVRPYLVRKGVQQRLSELDNPPPDFDEEEAADQVTPPTQQVVLLDYYHRSFWKAVRAKYLSSDQAQAQSHRELAQYFQDEEHQPYFLETLESQRKRVKRLPPTPRPGNVRKVIELPYQVLEVAKLVGKEDPEAPEWDTVADLLTNWQFLEAKAEA